MVLNQVHRLSVQFFNALPYLPIHRLVICEVEARAPMAEVTRKDEDCFWIVEILCKYFTVVVSHLLIHRARHDWDQFDVLS